MSTGQKKGEGDTKDLSSRWVDEEVRLGSNKELERMVEPNQLKTKTLSAAHLKNN